MTQFLELLVSGLSLGCIYALIAMGFVIIFKATNVVNFAHASVVMLGAYLVAKWHARASASSARPSSRRRRARWRPPCSTSCFVRPLRRARGVDALAILTIGVNILLATELTRRRRDRRPAVRRAVGRDDDRRVSASPSRRRASRRRSSRSC